MFSQQLLMDSWCKVVEVMVGVVNEEVGKEEVKVAVLFELIQDLLLKVSVVFYMYVNIYIHNTCTLYMYSRCTCTCTMCIYVYMYIVGTELKCSTIYFNGSDKGSYRYTCMYST